MNIDNTTILQTASPIRFMDGTCIFEMMKVNASIKHKIEEE